MEATKLLKQQHDEVKALFKRFEASEDDSEKQELFEQIGDDFAAHGEIEEKIFYPAIYVGELKEKLQEAVEEHLAAKRVVADLLEMEPADEQFDPWFDELVGIYMSMGVTAPRSLNNEADATSKTNS